jgi:DNA-binding response OmpR family regulator
MKRICLIEDDFDTQNLYAECLEIESFEPMSCGSGQEALEKISKSGLPDLILIDLNTPGLPPIDFLSKIRSQEGGESVPVIVISGDSEIKEKTKNLGAQDYLKKPFGIDPFIEIIKRWVS